MMTILPRGFNHEVFFDKRNTQNGVILVRPLGDRLNIGIHGLHLDKLRMINLHNGCLE